jgi:hypothetical protein
MILKFLFSLWYKERIVLKHLKASKDELRIGDTARFASDLLIKYKTFNEGDKGVYQEIVRTLLYFLFDYLASAFVNHTIDFTVSVRCSMHRYKVNTLDQARLRIQKGSFANIFNSGNYLSSEGSIAITLSFFFLYDFRFTCGGTSYYNWLLIFL